MSLKKGFDEDEVRGLAWLGYTPESARDYAVKKLEKANLCKEELDRFRVPVDQLEFSETDTIQELIWHKNEPEEFMKRIGRDLSDHLDYMLLQGGWD